MTAVSSFSPAHNSGTLCYNALITENFSRKNQHKNKTRARRTNKQGHKMSKQHTNQPPNDQSEERPSPTQKSVLIIDDERQVRETIEDILDMESVTAITAANGEDGVAQFVAHQAEIGLIILDLSMPGMSGVDTFIALRQVDPTAKIILSSGYSEADIEKKLGNMHPTGFLHKPYRLDTVLHIIKQHLA